MIEVMIQREKRTDAGGERFVPRSIVIEGHAGYADPGYDLVCAGVSAITLGIANAIVSLTGTDAVERIGKSGYLHFALPEHLDPIVEEKVILLLEAMLVALQAMAQEHGAYIQVNDSLEKS
ncbi:MAG: putative ribosomal protein [Candidatus Carbobacillus altaicus]|uniref:Ribosomal processing cysteine protease Prp n=1 Tax=Candidatus Carbonibacillus altaicus TaxID=2163959 RepID=A0A2R6Y580_9BACL|nr:MAG: putative ribosomal protein [Candidatus Carbobacillus altaicus]